MPFAMDKREDKSKSEWEKIPSRGLFFGILQNNRKMQQRLIAPEGESLENLGDM
jgi:hypothetical protein